jgi:hypothetical protein
LNPVFHKEIFSTLLLVPSLFDANIILSIQFSNTLNPCPSTFNHQFASYKLLRRFQAEHHCRYTRTDIGSILSWIKTIAGYTKNNTWSSRVGKVIAFVLHGEGSITDKARVFLRHYIQTVPRDHNTSTPNGYGTLLPARHIDLSPSCSANVKMHGTLPPLPHTSLRRND